MHIAMLAWIDSVDLDFRIYLLLEGYQELHSFTAHDASIEQRAMSQILLSIISFRGSIYCSCQ